MPPENQPLIEQFLQAAPHQQAAVLESAGMWSAIGFETILDYAVSLPQSQSETARELFTRVIALSPFATVTPRAKYLLAQQQAQAGDYESALTLIDQALNGFAATNQTIAAAGTTVGRMMVLGALGQFDDAISIANNALNDLPHSAEIQPTRLRLLQNRGLCFEQTGRYDKALSDYTAAAQLSNSPIEQSDLAKNRGIVLLWLGRATDALAAFTEAAALIDERDHPLRRGRTLANIGYAEGLLGKHETSLTTLQAAQQLLERNGHSPYARAVQVDSAETELALRLIPEALDDFRAAIDDPAAIPAWHRLRGLRGLGAALVADEQSEAAIAVYQEALDAAIALRHRPIEAAIRSDLAGLHRANGDVNTAQNEATAAYTLTSPQRSPVQHFFATLLLLDLAIDSGAVESAENYLTIASDLANRLPLPHFIFRLAQRHARLARHNKNHAEEETQLQIAIRQIEKVRGTLRRDALRTAFISDKATVYTELLALYLSRGRLEEALAVAERAKSRPLLELMQQTSDAREDTPELTELRQKLHALYNQLLDEGTERRGASNMGAEKIHMQILQIEQQIRRRRLTKANHSTWSDQHKLQRIATNQTVIAWQIIDDEILAFVRHNGELSVVRNVGSRIAVQSLLRRWYVQVRRFRAGNHFIGRNLQQLTVAAQRILQRLYQQLFAKLEDHVVESSSLTLIPHDLLHHVPMHALYDGTDYLLDRLTLTYAPSLSLPTAPRANGVPAVGKAAIFGVSAPALQAVSAETRAIANTLPHADLYLDHRATVADFRTSADADILHIATHGIFRSEHPRFSGFRLHDGWISATEITQLQFNHSLVVISACESGRSRVIGGEAVGLPRAFLAAGARSLIASLWLVQDDFSAEMMPVFYKNLQTIPNRAVALQKTQQQMRDRYPHPYHWAAFQLIGQP